MTSPSTRSVHKSLRTPFILQTTISLLQQRDGSASDHLRCYEQRPSTVTEIMDMGVSLPKPSCECERISSSKSREASPIFNFISPMCEIGCAMRRLESINADSTSGISEMWIGRTFTPHSSIAIALTTPGKIPALMGGVTH